MRYLALLLALCGCAKHPVIVVTATAALVGGLSCEIDNGTQEVCGITAGVVAVVLGGIAALVTTFADTTAHELPPDEEITPTGTVRLHTHTAPPPVELDAGVPDAAAPDAAVDAATSGT